MALPSVIDENSGARRVWDLGILGLIFLSGILIPFQVVFQGQAFGSSAFILYVIDFIFLVDIGLNFRTTFRRNGIEISDRKEISSHYLRSFFPVDLIANFPFELLMLGHMDTTVGGISVIVVLRMIRLLRVVRLFQIFRRWERTGWMNPSYLRITKFLGIMALLMHVLACGWFQAAAGEGFPDDSWVVQNGIMDAGSGTQYIRSLYWTISTMTTVGFGDVIPVRNLEYIVAIVVMLLGASMYAFIIGNVASILSHLDSGKVNHWRRIETVTEYLRSQQVPKRLVMRVRDYYEYLWARHRGLPGHTLVDDLPESLRLELLHCLAHDLLKNVPLFKYCQPSLRDALLMALKPHTYDPGSHVVREGDAGQEIFFICQGHVDIVKGDQRIGSLQHGDYFGHMSILLKEKRTASAVATTYCEMYMLSDEAYQQLQRTYPELRDAMKTMSTEASEKLATLILEGIVL